MPNLNQTTVLREVVISNVSTQSSLSRGVDGILLDNDQENPGSNQVYGTNSEGVKGWFPVNSGDGAVTVESIAELKALVHRTDQLYVIPKGEKAGLFYFDSTDTTTTEDSGMVFVASNGNRIKRLTEGSDINPKWFGVVGDGVTNDTNRFLATIQYSVSVNKPVIISGDTMISLGGGTLTIPENAVITFDGGTICNGTIVGNKTTIKAGLFKIFSTNVTLSGTFNMDYICPQHFGAKTNSSNAVFANACQTEIQKCIDSPIFTYLPAGFYYVTSSFEFTRPKTFQLEGSNQPDDHNNTSGSQITILADHARIYTDQDTDIAVIKAKSVDIIGGTFDVTKVDNYTKSVIRYDLNYKIWGGTFDSQIVGKSTGISTPGRGGKGVHIDQSNVTQLDGFVVYLKIKGYISYMGIGIYGDPAAEGKRTYVNSLEITTNMNGCKKFTELNTCDISKISGLYQCRQVLGTGEEDFPCLYVNGNTNHVDIFPWDLDRPFNASTGGIGNSRGIVFEGTGHTLGPYGLYALRVGKVEGIELLTTSPVINPAKSILSKDKLSLGGTVISKLDSETAALAKRHTVTVKKFKGEGIDFETDLDTTSLSETDDITIFDKDNLFLVGGSPMGIQFNEGADLESDFVEVEITPSAGTFRWLNVYIYMYQWQNQCKKIQFIEHYQDGTKSQQTITVDSQHKTKETYIFSDLANKASTKTLIRFIGGGQVGGEPIYILDIAAVRTLPEVIPYIHIEGGQRIYGDITVSQYKLADLNASAPTANATGTKGEIRITADYIYVCTATNTWKRAALTTW